MNSHLQTPANIFYKFYVHISLYLHVDYICMFTLYMTLNISFVFQSRKGKLAPMVWRSTQAARHEVVTGLRIARAREEINFLESRKTSGCTQGPLYAL